jgi:hypothetical protein
VGIVAGLAWREFGIFRSGARARHRFPVTSSETAGHRLGANSGHLSDGRWEDRPNAAEMLVPRVESEYGQTIADLA